MSEHGKKNYVEFPSGDFTATKKFFIQVFNWQFIDYGEDYITFSSEGLEGGFFK